MALVLVTFERGARLITGMNPNPKRDGRGRRGRRQRSPTAGPKSRLIEMFYVGG